MLLPKGATRLPLSQMDVPQASHYSLRNHFPGFSINDITPPNQEGIELIFFKVAYMCYMLDVMKTVLITQ